MKKVYVYVEGQTEETFVRDVLAPYLEQRCQIYLISILARTKRTKSGHKFKGGIVSYTQVKRDILLLLNDRSAHLVTTMLDYYGLPDDFPGKDSLPSGTPYQRVAHLERAFAQDIHHRRFLPFLMLHEFEALVLVQPEILGHMFPHYQDRISEFKRNIKGLAPEEINEGRDTHPAARILRYFPEYKKALHGPLIVQRTGLQVIRSHCPHFDDWLKQLESLCISGGR